MELFIKKKKMYGIVFILLYMEYMIVKLNLRFDNAKRFFFIKLIYSGMNMKDARVAVTARHVMGSRNLATLRK